MEKSIEKFLEFDGKVVSFLSNGGQWWVAIRPICDVLNVNYNRQAQNLREDIFLGQLVAEQQLVAADGKLRKMICLPEKFIYGWLFSIQSESQELIKFKMKCYDVLFEYFHGGLRAKLIANKLENTAQIERLNAELQSKLSDDPINKKLKELESANIRLGKDISQIEKEEVSMQLNLFREKYQSEN